MNAIVRTIDIRTVTIAGFAAIAAAALGAMGAMGAAGSGITFRSPVSFASL